MALTGCQTGEFGYKDTHTKQDYAESDGRAFTFAPIFEGAQENGYSSWYDRPVIDPRYKLSYSEFAGKRGKLVEEATEGRYGGDFVWRKAILESGNFVFTSVRRDLPRFHQVFFDDEIESARGLIGKTVWIRSPAHRVPLVLITKDRDISFPLQNLEPVIVIAVEIESHGHARGVGPFFLRMRKGDGVEGLLVYSERNIFFEDPIPVDASARIVQSIRDREVLVGMDEVHAILSWGEPDVKNRTVGSWGVHEQWVYGRQYLYFKNGKLTGFQTSN